MKASILFLLLFTATFFPQHNEAGNNNQGTVQIENAESFFSDFNKLKSPPTRGEFETREEYQKRLPTPFDSTKIYYLKILGMQNEGGEYLSHHTYDIDKQELTFFGKEKMRDILEYFWMYTKFEKVKKSPCDVLVTSSVKKYTASNSFGTETTVSEYSSKKYRLNFTNIESFADLPDKVRFKDGDSYLLKLTLQSPLKEAEELSKNVYLVVGFTTTGSSASGTELKSPGKPTFANPTQTFYHLNWINAKFRSLLLYNEKTGEVLARYDYPY